MLPLSDCLNQPACYFLSQKGAHIAGSWNVKEQVKKESGFPADSLFFLITKTGESRALMFLDWKENVIHMRKQQNPRESLVPLFLKNTPSNILSVNYFEHIITFVSVDGQVFGFDLKKVPEPLDFEVPLFKQDLGVDKNSETVENFIYNWYRWTFLCVGAQNGPI